MEPITPPDDRPGFSFRIATPALDSRILGDGTAMLDMEGFKVRPREAGAPDLPGRVVLVAIPPGILPELSFRTGEDRIFPGTRPAAVPEIRLLDAGPELADGRRNGERIEVRREREALYRGSRLYPEHPVRLGEIGVLRNQRYVAVHLTPARFDPSLGGVRVASWLEVDIRFPGYDAPASVTPADPWFEDVYRNTFANYAQGRDFRLGSAVGDTGSTPVPGTSASLAGGTDDPSARRRILVRENGPVRLDHGRMSGTGFLAEPISTWKLANRGVEVPLHVEDTDHDDFLDAGEWVQFYGQALDDEPKTLLNYDLGGDIDLYEAADFTDENVYFLTVESGARSRMTEQDGTPIGSPAAPSDFEAVAHEEYDLDYRPLGAADPWVWGPTLNPASAPVTATVPLPGLSSGTASARVLVNLMGRSLDDGVFPDHLNRVTLLNSGDQVLEQNDDDGTFDGRVIYLHDFTWDYAGGQQLTDPAKVRVEVLSSSGATDEVVRDWIEIRYRRLFQASGDILTFDWPDETAEFEVSNITDPSPEVYEITGRVGSTGVADPVRLTPVQVTGGGPYTVRFRVTDAGLPGGSLRRFVVAGDSAASIPANPDFTEDTVSDLRNVANQASMIVIAHPSLLDDPANCSSAALTDLLDHRWTQDGISSRVVCLEDIQDEFNDGLPGPQAIRNFLAWVVSDEPGEGWADPEPTFVLLLGDGSYDYKAGTSQGSYVPTQILFKEDPSIGYYASDNELAAVEGGDHLADLMVGRLSVRTLTEANTILGKLLDYEEVPATGTWKGHALLVSDRGKESGGGQIDEYEASEFERINDIAESKMLVPPHTVRQMRYWSGTDYCNGSLVNCNPGVLKQDIKDAIRGIGQPGGVDGAAMMQFTGHGNFELWSDDIVFCGVDGTTNCPYNDTNDLTNGKRLPWLVVNNCLSGGFHRTLEQSFGESWVKKSGGGALALLAPSGLGYRFIGERVTDSLWDSIYGKYKNRLIGYPVMDSQVELCGPGKNSVEACQYYVLLGDPASRLQIPAPEAPQTLAATAGNEVVDLDWTASLSATSHDIYRSTAALGTYQNIDTVTCSLGGSCQYQDNSVQNATIYYYYVVAVDGDGFESRWSNFNSDCEAAEPQDCVQAEPLNLVPPTPPVLQTLVDTEQGGRLRLTWQGSPEGDIKFYTVHFGSEPGIYTESQKAGLVTEYTLSGLQNGPENVYYVALSAKNTSGVDSLFSNEMSEYPTLVIGEKAPGFIEDLHVDRSGNNAALSWGAVTLDIYGRVGETVDRYEIFRGETPDFQPDFANPLASVPAGQTTWEDVDALLPAQPDYHYLVRAVDVDDNAGGAGRQLPDGIGDLMVNKAGECSLTTAQECRSDADCPVSETCLFPTTDLLFSWTPVTTVFNGSAPTVVERYDIYADDNPFGRAAIRDGQVTVLTSVPDASTRLTPPSQDRYYSVITVDNRGNESPF